MGACPDVLNEVFFPPAWRPSKDPIELQLLRTANCKFVSVEGFGRLFDNRVDINVSTWIVVVHNLAVDVLSGRLLSMAVSGEYFSPGEESSCGVSKKWRLFLCRKRSIR